MKTKLSHVRVNVKEFEAVLEWYTTKLHFRVAGSWPPEHPNYAILKQTMVRYLPSWRMKIILPMAGSISTFQI